MGYNDLTLLNIRNIYNKLEEDIEFLLDTFTDQTSLSIYGIDVEHRPSYKIKNPKRYHIDIRIDVESFLQKEGYKPK